MLHNILHTLKNYENYTIKMGQVLCIIPWHNKGSSDFWKPFANKIFAMLYLWMPVCGSYWFFCKSEHNSFFNYFDGVLSFCSDAIAVFFTTQVLIFSNFIKLEKWKKLLGLISLIKMNKLEVKTEAIWIGLGHLFFISTRSLNNYYRMHHDWKQLLHMPYEVVHHYYFFLSTLIACHYVSTIKSGFKSAADLLKTYTMNSTGDVLLEEKIREVGNKCRFVFELSEHYNDIFGWTVLLIFSNAIVQVLRATNLIMFLLQGSHLTLGSAIIFWSTAALCFAESIYIIACCESASFASRKIRLVCHKLQEDVSMNSTSRDEFFKLADVVATFCPNFTAANFFVINRGTILKIINLSTTYLLVIIQFYVTQRQYKTKI